MRVLEQILKQEKVSQNEQRWWAYESFSDGRFTRMRDALAKVSRPIYFAMGYWNEDTACAVSFLFAVKGVGTQP